MKLLAVEPQQYMSYYSSRYRQVEEFGIEVYVLNGLGTPDFWPADRYRLLGHKRISELIEEARKWHAEENFDGVITFAEYGVISTALIAEELGLPSIGVESAKACRNKLLMREAHQRAGAPIPSFRYVADVEAALAAAEDFGYPIILKPTMGAASYYVFKIDTPAELIEKFPIAAEGLTHLPEMLAEADGLELGPDGLLVESFLDGREYLIEALAWDDELYLGSVVDRITDEGGSFDDDVHHAPTSLSPDQLAKVHQAVIAGARAQGLRRSVMHAEVRFHNGEPHLLEIAARVGGGGLDMIARITAGYDPIKAVADVGAGIKPDVRHYQPTGTHIASMCLISEAGIIERIDVPDEVSSSDKTFLLKITALPGDKIKRPPAGNTILGFLGTTGNSLEDAFQTMTDFASKIQVTFAEPATVPLSGMATA
jgi:biotin carboxylase